MSARICFQHADFSQRLDLPLDWQVETLAWELPGGSASARVISLQPMDSLDAFNHLVEQLMAAPLEIISAQGEVIWTGWIASLVWYDRSCKMTVSIQNVYNRLIVRYPNPNRQSNPLNPWCRTGWQEDTASVARFGPKEKLISIPQADPLLAQKALQTQFELLQKKPGLTIEPLVPEGNGRVELNCMGWWQRLGWALDLHEDGCLAHLAGGKTHQIFGRLSSQVMLAQSFWVEPADFLLADIWLRAALVGQPTDDFQIAVHADDHGRPGAFISQADAPAVSLDGSWSWLVWQLPQPCLLAAGTCSWLVLKRSGSINSESYFMAESDDGRGYPRGSLRRWDGSTWQTMTQDLRFCLMAQEERNTLLRQGVANGQFGHFLGQFLAGESATSLVNCFRPLEMSLDQRMEGWLNHAPRASAIVDSRRNLQLLPLPRNEPPPRQFSIKPAPYSQDPSLWDGSQALGCTIFTGEYAPDKPHWIQSIKWRKGKGYSWKLRR